MNDIDVIILTFNEEIHIERCIRSVQPIAKNIFIVDSYSQDKTTEISSSLGAKVSQHGWKNYADQFQWASSTQEFNSNWTMRMDADEYLEPSLVDEIKIILERLPADIQGIYIRRKVFFMGKWIKYGGFYPHTLLRIWRTGQGRIEQRWMDEHIVLEPGAKTIHLKEHIVDDNLKGITFWVNKHNSYASREMADILIQKYFPSHGDYALRNMKADPQARWKRVIKDEVYNKLPPGLRALGYFLYRYILRLGFLDGGRGFIYHFLQGLWYRLLVDIKVIEVEKKIKGDPEKLREILKNEYQIKI